MNVLSADSNGKPTVISLFAGCGGSSLGYQMAGFKELLAIEWDQNAVDTFRPNFPDVPIYYGDIARLTSTECMKLAGIEKGVLDILDGSPPCQGFSTAGKRKWNDPRNSLFKEYARLLFELQPKVFVMENVTGMVKGCMKQAYLTIIKTLRECGYRAKGEVLNAMYFNVPQSRERVIIIGTRKDLMIEPTHPKPIGRPITPRKAFENCPKDEIRELPDYLRDAVKFMDAGNYSRKHVEKALLKVRGKKVGSMNTNFFSHFFSPFLFLIINQSPDDHLSDFSVRTGALLIIHEPRQNVFSHSVILKNLRWSCGFVGAVEHSQRHVDGGLLRFGGFSSHDFNLLNGVLVFFHLFFSFLVFEFLYHHAYNVSCKFTLVKDYFQH